MPITNPDTNSHAYGITDSHSHTYGFPYSYADANSIAGPNALRQRHNPERWLRNRQFPAMGYSRPKCDAGGNGRAGAQRNLLWIRW